MWRRSASVRSAELGSPWNEIGRPSGFFLSRPPLRSEPPPEELALASAAAAAAAAAGDSGGGGASAPVSTSPGDVAVSAAGNARRPEPERVIDIARVRLAALPSGIAGLQDKKKEAIP